MPKSFPRRSRHWRLQRLCRARAPLWNQRGCPDGAGGEERHRVEADLKAGKAAAAAEK